MAAPTFINSYGVSFSTTATTKNTNVTTQAGDIVVVYAGTEDSSSTLGTPTGNSIGFTLRQSVVTSGYTTAYVWTGTDNTGGSNWTLSINESSNLQWGFMCLVFRNSDGVGASSKTNVNGGGPSLDLTTTQSNSAIVVYNGDWSAVNGTVRTWRTVNGVTPSNGNGLERTYSFSSSIYTAYGGYYDNVGAVGTKTVGLTDPNSQKYSIVAVEIKGTPDASPTVVAWLQA